MNVQDEKLEARIEELEARLSAIVVECSNYRQFPLVHREKILELAKPGVTERGQVETRGLLRGVYGEEA